MLPQSLKTVKPGYVKCPVPRAPTGVGPWKKLETLIEQPKIISVGGLFTWAGVESEYRTSETSVGTVPARPFLLICPIFQPITHAKTTNKDMEK